MNVAAANPYRPRTEGAANGCSMTRGRANPSSHSVPRSTVTTRRASLLIPCLLSLLLRDHRVAGVARRLETGLEDAPPHGEGAREQQRTAGGGSGAALAAAPREQARAGSGARLGDLRVAARLPLFVDLADEAELLLHHLHQAQLDKSARERCASCRGCGLGRGHDREGASGARRGAGAEKPRQLVACLAPHGNRGVRDERTGVRRERRSTREGDELG